MAVLSGGKASDKVCDTQLNEIILTVCQMYRVSNYMFKVLTAKQLTLKSGNMFEHMGISENIYEGVFEPSYKTTRADANYSDHIRRMGGEYSP